MKLWGEVVFGSGTQIMRKVLEALCELPEPLRATRCSESEDGTRQPIASLDDLPGSMLWGERCRYLVLSPGGGPVECTCKFKTDPLNVRAFMERMATLAPTFGYACAWEEYLHRNQIVVKLRTGTLEAMLGKDASKYVPGLYWLTMLSESLSHQVPLDELEGAAIEDAALGGGMRIFRFHDHPAKWRERVDELDALCDKLPGIFSIGVVRRKLALAKVTELSEYFKLTRPWQ